MNLLKKINKVNFSDFVSTLIAIVIFTKKKEELYFDFIFANGRIAQYLDTV